ncbi:MAG: hypothetical protein KDE22_04285, partial [Rhodobacterales bacterium]|nr:hypothetical protein [Rhodobacterales bacterium]
DYMLGGSETAALPRHPNHLLFVEALFWARAAGFRQLHLGGGRPSLLYFKRGLSHRTLDYHLGRHVFLPEVYADLSARRDAWSGPEKPWTPDYFPRYRRGLGW